MATELCEELLVQSVPGLHFYTMNQPAATVEICRNLGIQGELPGGRCSADL
ncbi:MAG: methylenetetrahydrofolate reductase [Acidimicrobiales bacterium]